MSLLTSFLGLFKYEPIADKSSTFNITNALNNNFDKIDSAMSTTHGLAQSAVEDLAEHLGDSSAHSTLLALMANKDLSNITSIAKKLISKLSKSSSSFDNFSIGSTGGTYTAPANGKVVAHGTRIGTSSHYWMKLSVNGVPQKSNYVYTAVNLMFNSVKIKKDDVVTFDFDGVTMTDCKFYYDEGEV